MLQRQVEQTTRAASHAGLDRLVRGIATGTSIATQDGYLPIDFLSPGDRIVTREGLKVLRRIRVHSFTGPAVRVGASALGHDRPEKDLTLASNTLILVRDWRAKALFGKDQVLVPIKKLVDGQYVAHETVSDLKLFELVFDTPQVVYGEGVEVCCDGSQPRVQVSSSQETSQRLH